MARTHGRIQASIWRDADFMNLSSHAKLTYFLLLSQPKMSLAGVLDVSMNRWAASLGCTVTEVEQAVEQLDAARFVVVDHDTDELAIRTFVRHDIDVNRLNRNIVKGFWGAWTAIESEHLRRIVVEQVPVDKWERLVECAPPVATHIRRSAQLEPESESRLEPEMQSRFEPLSPLSCLLSPVSNQAAASTLSEKEPTPNRAAADSENPDDVASGAISLLVDRAIERNPSHGNPSAHRRSIERGKRKDYADTIAQALALDPELTAERLAEILEPTPTPIAPKPDPTAASQAARDAEHHRNQARINGTACDGCGGSGLGLAQRDETGQFLPPPPCPECTQLLRSVQ